MVGDSMRTPKIIGGLPLSQRGLGRSVTGSYDGPQSAIPNLRINKKRSTLETGGQFVRRGRGTEGRAWTTTKTCGHRKRGRSMAVVLRAHDHAGSR